MRAVVITAASAGPEVLEVQERPDPPVGPGEVRIAVRAAGINFADTVGAHRALSGRAEDSLRRRLRGRRRGRVGRRGRRARLRWATASWPAPASAATRSSSRSPSRTCPAARSRLSFEQGAAFPVNYAHRLRGARDHGRPARGRPGPDPRRGRRRRHRRDPDRPRARGRDLRHRLGLQARRDPRAGRRPRDRLPQRGLRARWSADHRRRGRSTSLIDAHRPDRASARTTACCAPAGA